MFFYIDVTVLENIIKQLLDTFRHSYKVTQNIKIFISESLVA